MMKNFMTSRSLTRGRELEEDLNGSDMLPIPGEEAVMMVYDGCLTPERRHVSNLSLGTPTRYGWGHGDTGV
jgi:hypothetical protein